MARGSRSSNVASRDPLRSLARALQTPRPSSVFGPGVGRLDEVEDGRVWHPDPDHGALTLGGNVARVIVHSRPIVARANTLFSPRAYPVGFQVPVGVRFESPLKVITCVRRKIRREIMFAKRRAGGGNRKPRRTWRSDVSC